MGIGGTQTTFSRRVHPGDPAGARMERRQSECRIFMVGIQQHQEILVNELPATFIGLVQSLAGEKHSQAADRWVAPLIFAHLITAGVEPEHVFYVRALDGTALKKTPATEYGMSFA